MFKNKALRQMLVATVLAGFAATLIVPGASAQGGTPSLQIDSISPPSNALFPEVDTGQLSLTYTYILPTGAHSLGGLSSAGVPITITPSCPSTVLVEGAQSRILVIDPATSQAASEYDDTVDFQVTISRNAPGLEAIECSMTVNAGPVQDPAIPAPDSPATQTFSVKADYYSLVQAKIASKIKQAGPYKQVPFEIELSNFGNARTQIAFAVTNEPSSGKWQVVLPDNLILDSPAGAGGKTSDISVVTVSTTYKNGWNNEQGSFQITMTPTAADQAEKTGNTLSANVLVRVRGVYVPGFEPVVMLGALVGAGLVARLRRDDEE